MSWQDKFTETFQHGFPYKPTALAWDPYFRIIAIGTATGAIKVYGRLGVEYSGQHEKSIPVTKIVFVSSQHQMITLCDDNSLHLWRLATTGLTWVKSQIYEVKLKKITTLCLRISEGHLLLGTEGGNVYHMYLDNFTRAPTIIYQEMVKAEVHKVFNRPLGAVKAIVESPIPINHIVIAYAGGVIVLWNCCNNTATRIFASEEALESICLDPNGKTITSSHEDGSYKIWKLNHLKNPKMDFVLAYGQDQCSTIPKIIRRKLRGKSLFVYTGGLPRTMKDEKFTVSVIHKGHPVNFDFSSKVIDFVVIESKVEPDTLVVLTEEELVVIDLLSKDWKMYRLPYLVSLHASAVTCNQHISDVPEEFWVQLQEAETNQNHDMYTNKHWPINGGINICFQNPNSRGELFLTGHEDGSVRFWDARNASLVPIYEFNIAQFFVVGGETNNPHFESVGEESPIFHKTGVFHPHIDDPRLAIKQIALCPSSGTLVVASTSGLIVVCRFNNEGVNREVEVTTLTVLNDLDGFIWRGIDQLIPKAGELREAAGFQAASILQLYPPAPIMTCVLQGNWGLIAAATAHGFLLYDYIQKKSVMLKCTLNDAITDVTDVNIRRRTFNKIMRHSFRGFRRKCSSVEIKTPGREDLEICSQEHSTNCHVRCFHFAETFTSDAKSTSPTFWVGTNGGKIHVFTIDLPVARESGDVTCNLIKIIQLKNKAPVNAIAVLDGTNRPLSQSPDVNKNLVSLLDNTDLHRVVVASEKQLKVLSLPTFKTSCKYKLAPKDVASIRRVYLCENPDTSASHLFCVTSVGECIVFTTSDLKKRFSTEIVKPEDINAMSSLVFTKSGEALYLSSSTDLQRASLSAAKTWCILLAHMGCNEDDDSEVASVGTRSYFKLINSLKWEE